MYFKNSAMVDSQEEVFHDVVVVCTAAVRQVTGREHDDGIKAFSIITWERVSINGEVLVNYWTFALT